MWQVYQYGHGKLKLTKDLKTAQSHLRASLIDQDEINNMGKIYNDRKKYYKIDAHSYTSPTFSQQANQQEAMAHLSYKEKVDLYRKRVQNEKLENKYKSLFKKTEKRKYKMRNPILFKMLQQFEEEYKHDQNLQIREDLKESQKNLEMIKINTHRKAKFDEVSEEDQKKSRPRFISLQNGLPEKQIQTLPKWLDYLEGRTSKPTKVTSSINVQDLENTFDSLISPHKGKGKKIRKSSKEHHRDAHSPFRGQFEKSVPQGKDQVKEKIATQQEKQFVCERCVKQDNHKKKEDDKDELHLHRNVSNKHQARKTMNKTFKGCKTNPVRPQENISLRAERTFSKSENYSKNMISTMQNFYQTKNHKKVDYQQMVFYLKKDRPLTSNIRRHNYRVISTGNIEKIKNYRSMSQKERITLKNINTEFYTSLLKQLERHNAEEISLSGKIMERLRDVFSSNYNINIKHFEYISEPALVEKRDQMSQQLLEQIQEFVEQHSK